MSDSKPIVVQYNVPRYIVGRPGSQFRACTGEMRITPGVSEAFDFHYNNSDGVPLNLAGFLLRLVFYYQQEQYDLLTANLQSNIVLAIDMTVSDPYSGRAVVLLSDQDTLALGQLGRSTLRWSVYMINEQDQVFATQITAQGERYGLAHLDRSELPSAETIKSITLTGAIPKKIVALVGQQATAAVGSFSVVTGTDMVISLSGQGSQSGGGL